MGHIIAIELDPKSLKDLSEEWGEMAPTMQLKLHTFDSLKSFEASFQLTDLTEDPITLILIAAEELTKDPIEIINNLKLKYKCEILVSTFDNPQFLKGIEKWPIANVLFKPYDKMILKEHTRFALLPNKLVKTEFVHTTATKAAIEILTKFRITHLSEFGFKLKKVPGLSLGQVYKFYHPLFTNNKLQHIWARVVGESDENYELLFCLINPPVISQIRRKVATSTSKVRGALWPGRTGSKQNKLRVLVHLEDPESVEMVKDLLERNFENITFVDKTLIKPSARIPTDLLITDQEYDRKQLESLMSADVTYVRLGSSQMTRAEVEARLSHEDIRLDKALDKAILVRLVKQLFPQIQEKELTNLTTIDFDETIAQSRLLEIYEFSEAAMAFKLTEPIKLHTVLDIILTQDDETLMKEMMAKVHFVDEKANTEKMFTHQVILFGMKDEFLKLLRLWALQKHIEANQSS